MSQPLTFGAANVQRGWRSSVHSEFPCSSSLRFPCSETTTRPVLSYLASSPKKLLAVSWVLARVVLKMSLITTHMSTRSVLFRAGSGVCSLLIALPPNLAHLLAENGEVFIVWTQNTLNYKRCALCSKTAVPHLPCPTTLFNARRCDHRDAPGN